jgi:cytochrome c oxidase cbb3-type subunit 3
MLGATAVICGYRWTTLLVALILGCAACNAGEVGDEPIARCVPAGQCDESMFRGGLSAALGDAARGATLYAQDCARCHGDQGKGIAEARRVDMTGPAWQASMRDGTIVKTLRAGRAPIMPAFSYESQQLKDLLAHIRTLQVNPAPAPTKGY